MSHAANRTCAACGRDRVVAIRNVSTIFPGCSALQEAAEAAAAEGDTHICTYPDCRLPVDRSDYMEAGTAGDAGEADTTDRDSDPEPHVTSQTPPSTDGGEAFPPSFENTGENTEMAAAWPAENASENTENTVTSDVPDEFAALPDYFIEQDRWICFKDKAPVAPWLTDGIYPVDGGAVQPDNWTDFVTAHEWASMVPGVYLGFVFSEADDLVGIDLDGCLDPETGDLEAYAGEILAAIDGYAEVSTSGTGIHVFAFGEFPESLKNEAEGVEIYGHGRGFVMTGDHYAHTPQTIPERQDVLDDLYERYMTPDVPTAVTDDGVEGGSDAPFYAIRVEDVYPGLPVGTNVGHPEHDSSTSSNFKIHDDGETAICWHGQHSYGSGDGCGLGAHHLLAMRVTGEEHCDTIRTQWADDDALVLSTYVHAIQEGLCEASPPPYRAVAAACRKHDLDGLHSDSAKDRWATFRSACRFIAMDHGFEIDLNAG